MKIGLVSPYVYPLPGGVNQHVRHLYENLRLRGHDVRIITSSHGLQRASEGERLMDWAFANFSPEKLVSLIHTENERSQALARRLREATEAAGRAGG